MNDYKNIQTKDNYDLLLKSGMFFEFYPELSGDWEKDKLVIKQLSKQLASFYHKYFNGLPTVPIGEAVVNGEKVKLEVIDESRKDLTRVIFLRGETRVTTFLSPELVTKY